jgi:predicted chitinase
MRFIEHSYECLNFAVVIVVFVAVVQVLGRAEGAAVGSVTNINPAIHVFQLDARASVAEFAAQVMADESVMVHVQP